MVKKIVKYIKFLLCIMLISGLVLPSYALNGVSDSSAFITKKEFDEALTDFNSRLSAFEAGINAKIDSQISSYLDRNGIWNGVPQTSEITKSYLKNTAGHIFTWSAWGNDHPTVTGSGSSTKCNYKGVAYGYDTSMYWDDFTKATTNKEITNTLDVLLTTGGSIVSGAVTWNTEKDSIIPWINELMYGDRTYASGTPTQTDYSRCHTEVWLSGDRGLFTANKSGLVFIDFTTATGNAGQYNSATMDQARKGTNFSPRNAFCFGWKWRIGETKPISGVQYNKFLKERYTFSLDFIDRTENPTPATVQNGLSEDSLFRYNWFESVMVPYDSNWYTSADNLAKLPNGEAYGMQTFSIPAFKTTVKFFVQKNHKYVFRVVGNRDTPYGTVGALAGFGMFYVAWGVPTSYYTMTANIY